MNYVEQLLIHPIILTFLSHVSAVTMMNIYECDVKKTV
jgi:hypothetical protein